MIEQARKELEEKRAQVAQRKSDLSSATYGIETRRKNEADKVQHGIKRLDYKGDRTHRDIVEMRASLCKSVARLSGLRMSRKRKKDGTAEDIYVIGPAGGVQIFDLKGLQDAPPDALSASLGLVAQLLVRVASYLGVRLPAEITLPHADYPQATIFQPASSYLGRKVPFPSARHSSTSSPEGSRTLDTQPNLPKPRLLYIDRPLHHLSAQDAPAYSLFIEAVSLLAYDVAWLCRSQGLKEQFDTWEEVSPMGRHLYRLLITQESNTPVRLENPLDKDTSPSGGPKGAETRDSARLGEISHATAHSFLGVAANAQYMGGLTLNPTKLTDDFKAFLLSEQQAQEWDVLSDKEWEDMEKLVAGNPLEAGMSVSDVETGKRPTKTGDGTSPAGDDESSTSTRKKGTSGWTKIKSRAEE
ncbi:hypothetical protein M011DRAFT_464798 [Sporormia fimetaria CBS 119925]|uniref:Autophagy-related protein 14 n=1 Tax=Sporormia fimetaria CBS 119925 TaxID=1340428 RepID=A0A6A6VK60_9PLEO|nr:hypothetical protein M011DRAFT_464798 [Sporormia fimetaria CBS 119925]